MDNLEITRRHILILFRFLKENDYYLFVMKKLKQDYSSEEQKDIIEAIKKRLEYYDYHISDFFRYAVFIDGWGNKEREKIWREIHTKWCIYCYEHYNIINIDIDSTYTEIVCQIRDYPSLCQDEYINDFKNREIEEW